MMAGLAALIMIVFGGVQYLTSVGDPGKTGDAKDQIFKAILGLVIMFSSWMILNTINPQLVELKEPGVPNAESPKPVPTPVIVGNCAEGQGVHIFYNVKLYSQANYQPAGEPIKCYNLNESEQTFNKTVRSVGISNNAIRFYNEANFSGENICFKSSFDDLKKCKLTCGWGGCQSWSNNIKSLQIINSADCRQLITLENDGINNNSEEFCRNNL